MTVFATFHDTCATAAPDTEMSRQCHPKLIDRSKGQREQIADIGSVDFGILAGAGAPTRSYKAGDVIFREGDPAQELWCGVAGTRASEGRLHQA